MCVGEKYAHTCTKKYQIHCTTYTSHIRVATPVCAFLYLARIPALLCNLHEIQFSQMAEARMDTHSLVTSDSGLTK